MKVLAQKYPAARICFVAGPTLIRRHRAFLLEHAYVHEVLECPEAGQESVHAWFSFLRKLRERRFELCIVDPFSVTVRAVHAYLSGIQRRVGLAVGADEGRFLTSAVTLSHLGHQLPDTLDLTRAYARALGMAGANRIGDFTPRFPYIPDRRLHLGLPQPIVAVHVGGDKGWNRRWPLANYRELCERLCTEAGASVCLIGGVDDSAECEAVCDEVRQRHPRANIRNLSGVVLNHTANYLAQARLFVGNDSAPMHIAAALGKPVIVLHGPVDAFLWSRMYEAQTICAGASCHAIDAAPKRHLVRQISCLTQRCPYAFDPAHPVYPKCMTDIPVRTVWQAVMARLQSDSAIGA